MRERIYNQDTMNKNNNVMALLSAASLLVITAIVLYAFSLGYVGGNPVTVTKVRANHTEVRVLGGPNLAQVNAQK
jgi:hypothetical protein